MTNSEKFKEIFGIYATEFWCLPYDKMCKWLASDVPDKNVGKWTDKEVIHANEAKEIITEWQSCKCYI